MGFLDFSTKNKKIFLIVGGTSLLTLGFIFLFSDGNET